MSFQIAFEEKILEKKKRQQKFQRKNILTVKVKGQSKKSPDFHHSYVFTNSKYDKIIMTELKLMETF